MKKHLILLALSIIFSILLFIIDFRNEGLQEFIFNWGDVLGTLMYVVAFYLLGLLTFQGGKRLLKWVAA